MVDGAQHTRQQGNDSDCYRPPRLLALLDRISESDHAGATWLLTATPMQVAPVELVDLLRHAGLSGPLTDLDRFLRFYAKLDKTNTNGPTGDTSAAASQAATWPLTTPTWSSSPAS